MDDDTPALGRRQVLGLAAAGAAIGLAKAGSAAAQAAANPAPTGTAAKGPGIPTPTPVVETRAGRVQGLVIDGVHHFRGIPLWRQRRSGRCSWAPPQPAKAWKGIYDASDFGAPAMQMAGGTSVDTSNDFGFQMHRVLHAFGAEGVMNDGTAST